MDVHQAPEIRAKPRDADRGGAGDVDNNTPVYHDTNQANMNAETDGMHNKQADRSSSQLLDPAAQGAQLCLLASKSHKSNVYKAYDRTRRARTFIPHWVVEYPWLEFNPEKECMFCIYCREYQKMHDAEFTNTFVHGATNFRLDSVKAHDNSTKHRQVMLVMSGKISIIPKPMSKLPRATGDRLRVGSFFDTEVNDGSYDVHGVGNSAPHPSMHRPTEDDETGQKHNIPSSDLLEEPFSTPNPMAKYIKTLQNIYPHLSLNGVSSENCQTTNILQQQPSQLTTPSPSRVGDAAPQGMEMEENIEEFIIKEEPSSPGQEEQAQGNYEREQGVEGAPSTSTGGGGGKIGRAVPPMRKVWNVTTNGAASLSQEEDGVDQGNDYEQTGNDTSNHLDQDHEDEAAEGLLHHSGAMQDFFINPVVPVMRQGRRTTRLLPKAKRQKLEMIMARQMHGEDVNNTSDDSSGDPRFHFDHEGDLGSGKSSSNDSQWKQLAESFLTKYNQLSEAHSIMMKQFQSKIAKLESKCKELEESHPSRQKAPAGNSIQEDGIPGQKEASGSAQSSPRINMYSSVIVLQLQGREPINISSTSDNNFSAVKESLSQSGIHISLGASNIPNTLEEQVSNLSRPVQRSLSKAGSPTTSSETTAVTSDDNVSKYNRTRDSNQVSGVGSTVQNELEIQHSGHENLSSDRRGYLMGNGVADGSAPSESQPPAPGRTDSTSHNAGDLSCDGVSHSNNPAVVLHGSITDCTVDQHSDEHDKIASTSASSTADDMVLI